MLRSSVTQRVDPCGPKNSRRMSLSTPTTSQSESESNRAQAEPIKPPEPVTIAFIFFSAVGEQLSAWGSFCEQACNKEGSDRTSRDKRIGGSEEIRERCLAPSLDDRSVRWVGKFGSVNGVRSKETAVEFCLGRLLNQLKLCAYDERPSGLDRYRAMGFHPLNPTWPTPGQCRWGERDTVEIECCSETATGAALDPPQGGGSPRNGGVGRIARIHHQSLD